MMEKRNFLFVDVDVHRVRKILPLQNQYTTISNIVQNFMTHLLLALSRSNK